MATTQHHPRIGIRRTLFYIAAAVAVVFLFCTVGDFIGNLIAEKRHGL